MQLDSEKRPARRLVALALATTGLVLRIEPVSPSSTSLVWICLARILSLTCQGLRQLWQRTCRCSWDAADLALVVSVVRRCEPERSS